MANPFVGRRVNLGLAKETTRGAGAAPLYWEPLIELNFDDKVERTITSSRHGVLADSSDNWVLAKYGEGSIQGEVRDLSFGLLLYAMTGAVSSAVKETTAYNHTFTISQTNNHQSLTFRIEDPIGTVDFPLVMLDSLTIDIVLGEIVKYEATFMSKTSKDSSGTASYTVQNRFAPTHLQFKVAADIASLAGAATTDIKEAHITFSKNLVRDYALGSIQPLEIFNQQMSIEGSIMFNYTDRTWRNYMIQQTFRAMRIDLINTNVTIGASSNPELQMNFPRVAFFDWNADRPLDEISHQTINFKAMEDVATSTNQISSIVLTNTATTY